MRSVGVLMMISGTLAWSSRLDYEPEQILVDALGSRLTKVDPNSVNDLSHSCSSIAERGWVLFILNANLIADTKPRTYFETAEERFGIWVEYDKGLVRLAQGLGAESLESNTEIPIRWVRRDERAFIAIAVTRDNTRVVLNATDTQNNWPSGALSAFRCDKVQIGGDNRELSEGKSCIECDATLRFAAGRDITELQKILDEISNVSEFNAKRSAGTALIVIGFLVAVRRSRQFDNRQNNLKVESHSSNFTFTNRRGW